MHYIPATYGLGASGIAAPLLLVALVWTLILKGFALWFSARAGQKWWFIVMLVVNTLGILEIVYLIWFRPKSDALTVAASADTSSEEKA